MRAARPLRGREQPVDLAELAADCITDLHRRATTAEIDVHAELEPAVARGDAALLERMIANLIDNAIRYNEPGGGVLSVATFDVADGRARCSCATAVR